MGPVFALVGAYVLRLGILVWIRPDSAAVQDVVVNRYPTYDEADPISRLFGWTRERQGPGSIWQFRLLGPINGAVFFGIGVWVTISQIHCRTPLPPLSILKPLFGPLEWRTLDGFSLIFILFAGVIGFMQGYRMRPAFRVLAILFALAFGISGSEAATYHVGVQANRWGVWGSIPALLLGPLFLLDRKLKKSEKDTSLEKTQI